MTDKDLKTLFGKGATFKIKGRDVPIKDLKVEDALLAEYHAQSLYEDLEEDFKKGDEQGPEDIIKIIAQRIKDYMSIVLELTPDEVEGLTLKEYREWRAFKDKQDLYDQGFNDQEIEQLKREAAKNNFRQLVEDIQESS